MKLMKIISFVGLLFSLNIAAESINGARLLFKQGDITKIPAQDGYKGGVAIVNAANSGLQAGGGVCGAIYKAAGKNKDGSYLLELECRKYTNNICEHKISVGKSYLTTAGNMKNVDFILHAVAPNFNSDNSMQKVINYDSLGKELLKNTYENVIGHSESKKISTLYIPFLSGGNFAGNVDKKELAKIAINSVKNYLQNNKLKNIKRVIFVLYSQDDYNLFTNVYNPFLSLKTILAGIFGFTFGFYSVYKAGLYVSSL